MGGQLGSSLGLNNLRVKGSWYLNVYEAVSHAGDTNVYALLVFTASWTCLYVLVGRLPRVPWSVPIATAGIGLGSEHSNCECSAEHCVGGVWHGSVQSSQLQFSSVALCMCLCALWFDRFLSSHGYISHLPTLGDRYGEMHASLWAPSSLSSPALIKMAGSPKDVGLASFSIAFVAVLESLISGRLADAMTHSEMDSRREVLGLSISNLICGVAGGLPATAALARTALSIRSGATSRVAGVMSATLTGLLAICLLPAFAYLPLSVVAALLFQVAIGMMESQHLRDAYNLDNKAFTLTVVVVILCLVFDPTVAIVVGAMLGLITQAAQVARGYSEVITNSNLEWENISVSDGRRRPSIDQYLSLSHSFTSGEEPGENSGSSSEPQNCIALYRVVGDLNYLSALTHTQRLRQLRHCHYIIISFRFCHYIDLDGLQQLKENITDLCQRGQKVLLCGIPSFLQPILCRSEWYLTMQNDGRVLPKFEDALASLTGLTSSTGVQTLSLVS